MNYEPVNFNAKFGKFQNHWSPRVVAEVNDYQFKLARIEGEFVWHKHDETDEAFVVLDGEMAIEFRDLYRKSTPRAFLTGVRVPIPMLSSLVSIACVLEPNSF